MAEHISVNNARNLFREAKKLRGRNGTVTSNIDGVTGDEDIANVFAEKFKDIFNSVKSCDKVMHSLKIKIDYMLSKCDQNDANYCMLDVFDIVNLIGDLKAGKSDGNLGLFSDHIINGSQLLLKYITLLFNSMIIHGIAPSNMSKGTLIRPYQIILEVFVFRAFYVNYWTCVFC